MCSLASAHSASLRSPRWSLPRTMIRGGNDSFATNVKKCGHTTLGHFNLDVNSSKNPLALTPKHTSTFGPLAASEVLP